jgi:hypothetical protein
MRWEIMNQKWFKMLITKGEKVLETGLWAKNLEEAREKAHWKWRTADRVEVIEETYQYHYSFTTFDGEKWSRMSVRDHELSDKEVQEELSSIFKEYDNVDYAILDKVVKI